MKIVQHFVSSHFTLLCFISIRFTPFYFVHFISFQGIEGADGSDGDVEHSPLEGWRDVIDDEVAHPTQQGTLNLSDQLRYIREELKETHSSVSSHIETDGGRDSVDEQTKMKMEMNIERYG